MEALIFCCELLILLFAWLLLFFHPAWHRSLIWAALLFFLPFVIGCLLLWLNLTCFAVATLRHYQYFLYLLSLINALLLLPSWYKLMWLILTTAPVQKLPDQTKICFTVAFSICMVMTIILLFTFYYLWIDALSGYTQGLRSALLSYQPVSPDFLTAFYFSFVCYFNLGFGDLIPYGIYFQLLVFLECLLSLLNTGIILFYAFHFLFSKE